MLMDPHRLSPHHNANSQEDIDFQKRAVNFLSHHMPREHMGVRHEARGDWEKLDHALTTDPAIRDSTLLKAIAQDAAKFYKAAETAGFTVPWQKLEVPEAVHFVQFDSAYQALQVNNKAADDLYLKRTKTVQAELGGASVGVRQAANALMDAMAALRNDADERTVRLLITAASAELKSLFAAARAQGNDADKKIATALGEALVARFTQLSARSVQMTELYLPAASKAEQALYDFEPSLKPEEGQMFLQMEQARAFRALLDELPRAAERAIQAGDSSTAQVYRNWTDILQGGFASIAH